MDIYRAEEHDVDYIVESLANHYQELNKAAGYILFNNNKKLLNRPIKKRVLDKDSDFRYFIAKEVDEKVKKKELEKAEDIDFEGEIDYSKFEEQKGFVATMLDGERGEILVLLTDDSKIAKKLLDRALTYLQEETNASVILAEESTNEDISKLMKDKGFTSFTENLILQVD